MSKTNEPAVKQNCRSYLIEVYTNDKGQLVEERNNHGFNPMYLLGLLERIQFEIVNQLENQLETPSIKKIYCDGKKINKKMLSEREKVNHE